MYQIMSYGPGFIHVYKGIIDAVISDHLSIISSDHSCFITYASFSKMCKAVYMDYTWYDKNIVSEMLNMTNALLTSTIHTSC